MKRIAYSLGILIIALYAVALLVPFDPEERRPGTTLSGTITENNDIDWSFLQPQARLYVQTNTWYGIAHSVTTTSFVDGGELYVPCAVCDTKRWPKNVARDPNVIVKHGDTLYPRRAVLVTDMSVKRRILDARHADVALYRMDPR